jgi:hypothetical protein
MTALEINGVPASYAASLAAIPYAVCLFALRDAIMLSMYVLTVNIKLESQDYDYRLYIIK